MKFSDACVSALGMARRHGWVFYVHDSPSLWDVTSVYKPGWLFKAYPGGRGIVSPAGKQILESERRVTNH